MRLAMSALLFGTAVSACSSTVDPATLAGKWSEVEQLPGNSLDMTLATSGSNVSGSGNWCGEALRCGTVTVSGTLNGDAIHLDIVFDSGVIDHFDGRISLLRALDGSVREEVPGQQPQPPHAVSFRRA